VEFSSALAAMLLAAAGPLLTAALTLLLLLLAAARHRAGVTEVGIRAALAVAGVEHDLELVQLVPFGIGTLPFGNRLQLLQALARRNGF
jgi:hypothetical protein